MSNTRLMRTTIKHSVLAALVLVSFVSSLFLTRGMTSFSHRPRTKEQCPECKYEPSKWGYIDNTGKFVITPRFSDASSFCKKYAQVCVSDQSRDSQVWKTIDKTGQIIGSAEVLRKSVQSKPHPTFFGTHGLRWRYVDDAEQPVINAEFIYASDFAQEGLAVVQRESSHAYEIIDRAGHTIAMLPAATTQVGGWSEGLLAFSVDPRSYVLQKWGFVDQHGNIVVSPRFDDTGHFSEGLCPVRVGGHWRYIDTTGRGSIMVSLLFASRRTAYAGLDSLTSMARSQLGPDLPALPTFPVDLRQSGSAHWGFLRKNGNTQALLALDWI